MGCKKLNNEYLKLSAVSSLRFVNAIDKTLRTSQTHISFLATYANLRTSQNKIRSNNPIVVRGPSTLFRYFIVVRGPSTLFRYFIENCSTGSVHFI